MSEPIVVVPNQCLNAVNLTSMKTLKIIFILSAIFSVTKQTPVSKCERYEELKCAVKEKTCLGEATLGDGMKCVMGCYCKDNRVRYDSACIQPDECPDNKEAYSKCGHGFYVDDMDKEFQSLTSSHDNSESDAIQTHETSSNLDHHESGSHGSSQTSHLEGESSSSMAHHESGSHEGSSSHMHGAGSSHSDDDCTFNVNKFLSSVSDETLEKLPVSISVLDKNANERTKHTGGVPRSVVEWLLNSMLQERNSSHDTHG